MKHDLYTIAGYDVKTLCAKRLLNGPCGGVRDGKCEVGNAPCVWVMIYGRMLSKGMLDDFTSMRLPESMKQGGGK